MSNLTDAAKAEIAAAIAIVREDRFEKYVRARQAKPNTETPPANPPADPPKNEPPANPPVNPPPPKDTPPDTPPPVSNYSKYWGEILSE